MRKVSFLALTASGIFMVVDARAQDADQRAAIAGTVVPSMAELEASGAIIGRVIIDKQNVFDLSKPGENKALFRLTNRWHIVMRDAVIEQQLLFRSGEMC